MNKTLRDKLIDEMFKALYYEGYHACNLNTILQNAGTSKGGMYHHFTSKHELALVTLETVLGDYIHRYWEEPLEKSENPLQTLFEKIDGLADAKLFQEETIHFKFGSPLNNMIQELTAVDKDFANLFQSLMTRWEHAIVATLTRARKWLRIDTDIEEAASFIVASIEGSFGNAKVFHSKERFTALMRQLHAYIQSLVRD